MFLIYCCNFLIFVTIKVFFLLVCVYTVCTLCAVPHLGQVGGVQAQSPQYRR